MKANPRPSRLLLDTDTTDSLLSSAGGGLLARTAGVTGLDRALSQQMRPWRSGRAIHDPGKTLLDLAVAIGLGGDCLADVALVRAQPQLFGTVASDPTISRLLRTLADDGPAAAAAIRAARAQARQVVWSQACPVTDGPVVVDLDATLVTAHSEKEQAAPTFKRGFGFHPLLAFVDHGEGGTGEPLVGMLRSGKATANNAADHVSVLDAALGQLPAGQRSRVLVRGDSGAGTKAFLHHVTDLGLGYSVGIAGHQPVLDALARVPRQAWRAAVDGNGQRRDAAQVAELTRWLPDTWTGWPDRMRIIARRERPHPGAQLRITDHEGWRITLFATNTRGGRLADLEARHRARARAEDRIRCLKDSGLSNLPLHAFTANQLWVELVLLAADLLVWTQMLGMADTDARLWEPKRLRLRLLHVAGRITRSARRNRLKLPTSWPWNDLISSAWQRLQPVP